MSELVTGYLEGALPLRVRLAARVHLFRCTACANYYEQMRQTVRVLGQGTFRPPEPAVEEQVLRKAADQRPDKDNG